MHTKRRPNNGMNGGGNGNGQHRHHNNHNNNRPRRFNNNRPQGSEGDAASVARTRRNAVQNREKFQMMARDAMSMGDRVLSENYLQHADHYHRVLLELPPEEAPRPQYQRNYNPQDPQGQNPQQTGDNQQPHAGDQQSHMQDDNQHHPVEQPSPHALPSFITQAPQNPAQPQDE